MAASKLRKTKNKNSLKTKKFPTDKIYYNLTDPVAYTGARNIISKYPHMKTEIKQFLNTQDAYTLHKPVKRKFPRLHYNVSSIDSVWEADLVDLQSIKSENGGITFLLTVIDVLSKYLWIEPLKNKTGEEVCRGFERIFKKSNGRMPVFLQTDSGTEFKNKNVQKMLEEANIYFRVARNPDIKASIVERVIRTVKERIWRYFTHKRTHKYIDILQQIVDGYNNSYHSTIKMTPAAVTIHNVEIARRNIENHYSTDKIIDRFKYKVNDHVRISTAKGEFQKGYTPAWSQEIFKITKATLRQSKPIYEVCDLAGESIDGMFYEQELSPVNKNINESTFKIEKILKTRGKGKKKEYFVHWYGWPSKFDSWIPASNIQ